MRPRRPPVQDPEVERTLSALDALLAGDPAADVDAELAELVAAIGAERPVPREEFARALDERATGRFRRRRGEALDRRARNPLRHVLRPVPLAAGTGAAAFIVVVAIVSGGGGNDSGGRGGGTSMPTSAQNESAPAGADSGGIVKKSAPAGVPLSKGPGAPSVRERKVVRSASLTLAPPPGDVEDVADDVVRITDRYDGFVFDSSVSSGDDGARGTLDLRLPSSRLQAALADLSRLAHVRARSQASQDITARFTGPRRRLADALGERRALLRLLAVADTPNETASIRARLRLANDRIDAARAALRRLENRVGFAAVSVAVEPGDPKEGGAWTVGDAAGDAVTVLKAITGALLIALAVLAPPSLLLLLFYAGRRVYLRRAREASLGPVEKPTHR